MRVLYVVFFTDLSRVVLERSLETGGDGMPRRGGFVSFFLERISRQFNADSCVGVYGGFYVVMGLGDRRLARAYSD